MPTKELIREHDDGPAAAPQSYTVADAVTDGLDYGLSGRSSNTIETGRILANQHVIPDLGARKLSELSAEDVDRWLAEKAQTLSTSTLQRIRSILSRALARAQARDKVKRAEGSTMGAYVVLSLLTGARTEELRALTWAHVDLDGDAHVTPPVPPHIMV